MIRCVVCAVFSRGHFTILRALIPLLSTLQLPTLYQVYASRILIILDIIQLFIVTMSKVYVCVFGGGGGMGVRSQCPSCRQEYA